MIYDVLILGCGVVGAACAYALSKYDARVLVLEADNDVANGTTKANSAIVHAGYDPKPDMRMARLNVEGNRMMGALCEKLDVPFARIGSLVLALEDGDLDTLKTLYERGVANGVPDLQLLDREQTLALEPNVTETVQGALYAPSAGIVNPWELCLAMAETAVKNGVELRLRTPAQAITKNGGLFTVSTPNGDFTARYILNCTGVNADKTAELICPKRFTIEPAKGEYFLLDKSEGTRVSHTVFQCPSKVGKGVLVSPTVHGNLLVGPNAVESAPEDTATTADGLDFVRRMAVRSVPSVSFRENIRNFAGVRANSDDEDFIIGESPDVAGFFQFAGIRSPGLSAAPAIGEEAVALLREAGFAPAKKAYYDDSRKRIRFHELSGEEKNALIAKDPRYGRVICRCETVTEGEIVESLHRPIPPLTVNGVKRRVGAGMGRCQGGFCGPRVQEILAREYGVSPTDILMDQDGTWVLCGETKNGGAEHG